MLYYCVTNYHKHSDLKQYISIISQFPSVRSPCHRAPHCLKHCFYTLLSHQTIEKETDWNERQQKVMNVPMIATPIGLYISIKQRACMSRVLRTAGLHNRGSRSQWNGTQYHGSLKIHSLELGLQRFLECFDPVSMNHMASWQ